jgi:hypothetical protein
MGEVVEQRRREEHAAPLVEDAPLPGIRWLQSRTPRSRLMAASTRVPARAAAAAAAAMSMAPPAPKGVSQDSRSPASAAAPTPAPAPRQVRGESAGAMGRPRQRRPAAPSAISPACTARTRKGIRSAASGRSRVISAGTWLPP